MNALRMLGLRLLCAWRCLRADAFALVTVRLLPDPGPFESDRHDGRMPGAARTHRAVHERPGLGPFLAARTRELVDQQLTIPMPRPSTAHVVMHDGQGAHPAGTLECERCRQTERVPYPIAADALVQRMKAFTARHAACSTVEVAP